MRHARAWLAIALAFGWGCGGPNETDEPDAKPSEEPRLCEPVQGAGAIILPDGEVVDDLRSALLSAQPGDELRLCPGRYLGNFVAEVPLRLTGIGGAAVTILDGISDLPTLELPGDSEVEGLTIRGGGGVRMSSSGSLLIVEARISGNQAEYGAGLVVAENSVATLSGTEIMGNRAEMGGGGVWVQPGGRLELLDGSRVSANWAGVFGAGIWLQEAHLDGGLVSDNVLLATSLSMPTRDEEGVLRIPAETFGGSGVALSGSGSLTGAEITSNTGIGGAFSVSHGTADLTDVWIHDNHSDAGNGGGIGAAEAHVVGEGNTRVERNSAAQAGGGAWVNGASISGVSFSDNVATFCGGLRLDSGELRDVVITGNEAARGSGGGVCATEAVRLENVNLVNNQSSSRGGGLSISYSGSATEVTIVSTTISGNRAEMGGAGIYASSLAWEPDSVTVRLVDSEIAGNSTPGSGGGVYTEAPFTLENSRITSNMADQGGGVWVAGAGALTVIDSDLGAGEHDNSPDDVATTAASYQGYGSGADFTCDSQSCTPEP